MDAIEKNNQLEVKRKNDKTKDIVYLKEATNKLDDLYPNSFSSKCIILLKRIESYEHKVNYEDLSCKILLLRKMLLDLMRLIF